MQIQLEIQIQCTKKYPKELLERLDGGEKLDLHEEEFTVHEAASALKVLIIIINVVNIIVIIVNERRSSLHANFTILDFFLFLYKVFKKKYMPTSSIAFLFFLKLKSYSAQALLARLEEPLLTDLCFPAITRYLGI